MVKGDTLSKTATLEQSSTGKFLSHTDPEDTNSKAMGQVGAVFCPVLFIPDGTWLYLNTSKGKTFGSA